MVDTQNNVYVSLVMYKTKVAHIKAHIPRLELCGAQWLSKLHHLKTLTYFSLYVHILTA